MPYASPGRLDVAFDVGPFLVGRVRAHRELLDHQRPHRADQDRGQHQQRRRHRRDAQVTQEDRREERQGTDHRDREQDELGREHRVDVGVAGTGEGRLLAAARQQGVAVQPVRNRLQQHERAGEHRELDARRLAQRTLPTAEPQAAEDVVGDQVRQEGDDQRDEQPVQHHPVEGQVEGVEPDVETELRVLDAEGPAVEEQLHRHPVRLGDQAAEHTEDGGDADPEQLEPAHHHRAVALDRIVRAAGRREHRPRPVGQDQAEPDQAAHQQGDDQEQHDAGEEHLHVDVAEPDLTEPEPVGVRVDQSGTDQQQRCDHQPDAEQDLAPARQRRDPAGGPHAHVPHSQLCSGGTRPQTLPITQVTVSPHSTESFRVADERIVRCSTRTAPSARWRAASARSPSSSTTQGWDLQPQLFALVPTADLAAAEPALLDQLDDGHELTPIAQDPLPPDVERRLARARRVSRDDELAAGGIGLCAGAADRRAAAGGREHARRRARAAARRPGCGRFRGPGRRGRAPRPSGGTPLRGGAARRRVVVAAAVTPGRVGGSVRRRRHRVAHLPRPGTRTSSRRCRRRSTRASRWGWAVRPAAHRARRPRR